MTVPKRRALVSTRRLMISALLVSAVAGCSRSETEGTPGSEIRATGSATPQRPNILLIVADDMGLSDIGSFGGEIATPTLDALAAEGLRLTNFHVLPSCSPSRSVLLSGMDNHRAGLGAMAEFKPPEAKDNPGYAGYLNFEVAALPEVLKAGGYRSYMVGKWHLGDTPETVPHARGFDETFVLLGGGGSHWADRRPPSPLFPMTYNRNGRKVDALPEDFYSTKYYTDQLLQWLERDRDSDRPFFAYLAYTAPHDPLHAPKAFIDKYRGAYQDGWDKLREKRLQRLKDLGIVSEDAVSFPRLASVPAWDAMSEQDRDAAARDMEVYAAMIDFMDGQIGRVLVQLRESGEYDNTMIIFFSDNGANGVSHEAAYPGMTDEFIASFDNSLDNRGLPNSFAATGPGWAQASMTPSRMFKAFTAEGGIRAPLLVKLPGEMREAGRMNHALLHIRDIMPAILDVAGVEHPGREFKGRSVRPPQGASFRAALEGQTATMPTDAAGLGYELFGQQAYIHGNWKILNHTLKV